MILSRNQLLKIFSDFAEAHEFINDFGYGDTSEIGTSRQMKFPYMWVSDNATNLRTVHQTKNQTAEHGFVIAFLDQENIQENFDNNIGFDSNNRQEVMSDTFQFCQDFVTFIQTQGHEWGVSLIDDSVTAQRTYDDTTDKVYGWFIEPQLRTRHFNCDIPGDFEGINPFPPCPEAECDDASVSNSDDSYTATVESGGSLELPDINVTINGEDQGNFPSVQNLTLSFTCPASTCNSAEPLKSGQTISYATNDDGDLELGRDTDFVTLEYENPFGNFNRFTDELGGQTFTNMVYIDWTTFDTNNERVLGYIFADQQGFMPVTWASAMSNQPYTYHGYNDWFCANMKQTQHLINWGVNALYDYAPINYAVVSADTVLWTSTTYVANTGFAWYASNFRDVRIGNKTSDANLLLVRYYTLTELGL